jgi:hypothetical protein
MLPGESHASRSEQNLFKLLGDAATGYAIFTLDQTEEVTS